MEYCGPGWYNRKRREREGNICVVQFNNINYQYSGYN